MTDIVVGTCKWFNSQKGFGFLTPSNGGEDVFVHQSVIHAVGFRSLAKDEPVEFQIVIEESGRSKAINVTGPNGAHVQGAPRPAPHFGGQGPPGDYGAPRERGSYGQGNRGYSGGRGGYSRGGQGGYRGGGSRGGGQRFGGDRGYRPDRGVDRW